MQRVGVFGALAVGAVSLLPIERSAALAADITAGSRVEAARRSSSFYYTWTRSSAGDVVAMDDHASVGGSWINYGKPGGVAAGAKGMAVTSYQSSGSTFTQFVFHIGTNGSLYEGVKFGTGSISWTQWLPPAGKTLTGHIAAGNVVSNGTRYVAVLATTTDGLLYRWIHDVSGGFAPTWSNVGGSWKTDTPLAATTSPSEQTLSFFGSKSDGAGGWQLGMVRLANGTWTSSNQGGPGFSVCDSLAVSQGQLSSTLYRLYVVCTATSTSSTIGYAYGTSETDSTLSWLTETLPSSVSTVRGNLVAAVLRPDGSNNAIDFFVLSSDNHIRRRTRSSAALESTVDLGTIEEASFGYGGAGSWATWPGASSVGPQDDGRDQFMPEVSITKKTFTWEAPIASEGEVYVFWYDRNADPNNVLYRVRASKSVNGGASWYSSRTVNGVDSNPIDLPRHCRNPTGWRFIGDYSATRASKLHTHFLYVTVPGGSIGTNAMATFRSLGSWRE